MVDSVRQRKAGTYNYTCKHQHKQLILMALIYADITGRKQAIDSYLQEVKSYTDETEDADVLDRVLSLLTQASAALKSVCHKTTHETLRSFEVRDKFVPTQNKTKLRLEDSKSPREKASKLPNEVSDT